MNSLSVYITFYLPVHPLMVTWADCIPLPFWIVQQKGVQMSTSGGFDSLSVHSEVVVRSDRAPFFAFCFIFGRKLHPDFHRS